MYKVEFRYSEQSGARRHFDLGGKRRTLIRVAKEVLVPFFICPHDLFPEGSRWKSDFHRSEIGIEGGVDFRGSSQSKGDQVGVGSPVGRKWFDPMPLDV